MTLKIKKFKNTFTKIKNENCKNFVTTVSCNCNLPAWYVWEVKGISPISWAYSTCGVAIICAWLTQVTQVDEFSYHHSVDSSKWQYWGWVAEMLECRNVNGGRDWLIRVVHANDW